MACTLPRLRIEPAARRDAPGDARQRWFDHQERLIATGGRTDRSWWMHWPGLATFWFGETGNVRAESHAPGREHDLQDIFTRGVTPVVLLARGFEGLHASAIDAGDGTAAALVGTSGTGKSTIAFAVASTGLRHLADDTVVYQTTGGSPTTFELPFPVRIDASVRHSLSAVVQPPDVSVIVPGPRLGRIYHLVRDESIDPSHPVLAAVPPARRFEVLLAHAHPFEMGSEERRRASMESLFTLARVTDVWECRFAPDLSKLRLLAAAIRDHLCSEQC